MCASSRIGLQPAGAVIPHHQVGLLGIRASDEDVGIRKPGRTETFRQRLGDGSGRPGRIAGLAFDHLLVDFVSQPLVRFGRHRGRAEADQWRG